VDIKRFTLFIHAASWYTGANVIKLFAAVNYDFSYEARAFVPGKPFQHSLMFCGKVAFTKCCEYYDSNISF
jgi:hypothetical protein